MDDANEQGAGMVAYQGFQALSEVEADIARFQRVLLSAARFIKDTDLGATRENFYQAYAPVGETIWGALQSQHFVSTNEVGKICLTESGETFAAGNGNL